MAKTTAPLFGFEGVGTVGKSITFSKWRGVKYAKRYTVPGNPNTTAQQQTRNIFAALNAFWKLSPNGMVDAWTAYATGRAFVNRNAFLGKNVKLLRNATPLTSMVTMLSSPGAGGGAPPSAIALTPGSGQISAALTLPQVPTGWTLDASRAIAFVDQAPADAFAQEIFYNEETTTPQTNVMTGLASAETYVMSCFLKWSKPDGSAAYSVSIADTALTT